jgi:type II secretory pathway pseudopilin PulG
MRRTTGLSRPQAPAGFTLVHLLVLLAILVLLIAMVVPMITRLRQRSDLAHCKDNLRQIGATLLLYTQTNNGKFPVSATVENPHPDVLDCLTASHLTPDPAGFYCPAEHRPALCFSPQNFKSGIIGYYYFSASKLSNSADPAMSKFLRSSVSWPRELNTTMAPNTWIMSDIWVSSEPTSHAACKKGVNFLKVDGSVGFVAESPRQQFH